LQIVLTLARPKLAGEDPQKLFWEHPLDALKSPGWPGLANYKVLAAFVFVVIGTLYCLFH
jgi:SSS family solute:Na+ symporter